MSENNINSNFVNQFKVGLGKSGVNQSDIEKLRDDDIKTIFEQADAIDGTLDGKISEDTAKQMFKELGIDPNKAAEEFSSALSEYEKYNASKSGMGLPGSEANASGQVNASNPSEALLNNPDQTKTLSNEQRLAQYGVEADNAGLTGEKREAYIKMRNANDDEKNRMERGESRTGESLGGNVEIPDVGKIINEAVDRAVETFRQGRAITSEENEMIEAAIKNNMALPANWGDLDKVKGKDAKLLQKFLKLDEFAQSRIRSAMFDKTHGREDRVIISDAKAENKPKEAQNVKHNEKTHKNTDKGEKIEENPDSNNRETKVEGASIEIGSDQETDNSDNAKDNGKLDTSASGKNKKAKEISKDEPEIGSKEFRELPKTRQARIYKAEIEKKDAEIKEWESQKPDKSDTQAYQDWQDHKQDLKDEKDELKNGLYKIKPKSSKSLGEWGEALLSAAANFVSGDTKNYVNAGKTLFGFLKKM